MKVKVYYKGVTGVEFDKVHRVDGLDNPDGMLSIYLNRRLGDFSREVMDKVAIPMRELLRIDIIKD